MPYCSTLPPSFESTSDAISRIMSTGKVSELGIPPANEIMSGTWSSFRSSLTSDAFISLALCEKCLEKSRAN